MSSSRGGVFSGWSKNRGQRPWAGRGSTGRQDGGAVWERAAAKQSKQLVCVGVGE